jgi:bifunctional DNA primase/polymerase-like protein
MPARPDALASIACWEKFPMAWPDEITRYRQRLRAAGFPPLPVYGKKPTPKEWGKLTDTNDAQIALWPQMWPTAKSTGVLTRLMPALDIDIFDESAAAAVEDLVRGQFEDRGRVLVRIGKAPKRAVPFRTVEPFKKMEIGLIAPDGDTSQKLEFLCNGQQLIVDGIHPTTGLPYRWLGGELRDIARDDLPEIDKAAARDLIEAAAELLCRDFGYRRASERPYKGNGTDRGNGHDRNRGTADWSHLLEHPLRQNGRGRDG